MQTLCILITILRFYATVSLIYSAYEAIEKTNPTNPIALLLLLNECTYLCLFLVSNFLKYFTINRHLRLFNSLNTAAKKFQIKSTIRVARFIGKKNFGICLQLICIALTSALLIYYAINMKSQDSGYALFWFWSGYDPLKFNTLTGIAKFIFMLVIGATVYEDQFRNMLFLLYSLIYYVLACGIEHNHSQQQCLTPKFVKTQCIKLYRCSEKFNRMYSVLSFFAELHDILYVSLSLLPELDLLPEAGICTNIITSLLKIGRYLLAGLFAQKVCVFC